MSNQKNFVSLKDETVRIFENPFLDWCSRIHWSFPLIVWIPVILYCLYSSVFTFQFGVVETLAYLFVGLVIWTLSEYFIHRFVFHYHPTSDFGKKIAFLMHGIHHDYPNDSKRLVMPPIMSILLSIPFIFIFKYAFGGQGASYSAFSGMVIGYLCYDMLHYAVHHARWDNPLFVHLKKHHMAHHFVAPEEGFGVSNIFWDKIFRTEIKPR
jgi:sterol desaturase/sphingolipid hydroxylase (fatty acid hydroxylase superfamily)